ncbi:MAG: 50S ribosomal protein L30 [Deltaproteobacteria bacterium]|nr:50S ribosomal protein L30 [Deltaproteobacteria bacterium]
MAGKLRITVVKSRIGRTEHQRRILDGLGLKKTNQTVELEDTPAIRGMIKKLEFMLRVESA